MIRDTSYRWLLALLVSGCSVGVGVDEFKPAQRPEGVLVKLKLTEEFDRKGSIAGELLEVRDDGFLVNVDQAPESNLSRSRVVFVPYRIIFTVDAEQMGRANIASQSERTTEAARNRMRLVSRFPQGLSEQNLQALLAAQGQHAVDELGKE